LEKSYYENPYEKEFTAEIINVIEKDNKYHIELDKTHFCPNCGEQPHDSGFINNVPVINVYEDNNKIYHVVEIKPLKIHKVKCIIDWNKKFDYMQQHLGQHILSACLNELFNANTIFVDLGDANSYIDIDRVIEKSEITRAEETANRVICDNIMVEVLYLTNAELKKLSLKKIQAKAGEKIRIVKIGHTDARPCLGIHPNSTIEVQIIKVIKCEKRGNGTRVSFICGSRAVSNYLSKYETIEKVLKLLNCSDNNMLSEIERLKTELNKSLSDKASLKSEVADYEVEKLLNSSDIIKDIRIISSIYDNVDLKYINLLTSKLVSHPKVIVLFAIKLEDKAQLVFIRSKDINAISMNTLLKDAVTLIDGKGGGSDFSAQGAGKSNNNLPSLMDYAYNKIKSTLMDDNNK